METTKEPRQLVNNEKVALTKDVQGAGLLQIDLGWDEGENMDPDASLVMVHEDGTVTVDTDLLFYNQNRKMEGGRPVELDGKPVWNNAAKPYPFILDGAIASILGDNRDGAATDATVGDAKERITIDFSKIPATVKYLVPFITLYEAKTRKQHFGDLKNAFVRISDTNNAIDPIKSDLSEDYSAYEAMIPGYIYKVEGEWKFVKEDIGVNETAASLGEVPNVINMANNIVKLAKLKIGATA
jgi:tellurium resistance protein TerD